jgi:RNA polymerase sigma-70 factor (ECF subfamily)
LNDSQIVALFFDRDQRAIQETDAKYGKLCYSVAYNILDNNEDSQECVNDTYVGVWNTIPPTKPDNFSAFICRITRNLSLKRLESISRHKRSYATLVSLDEISEILPDQGIADGIDDEAIGKIISNFLRNEKEDVRNIFIRKYYFFDSIDDIANRYGFTKSKVKNMLFRTRNKLREYLIKEGVNI